MKKNIFAALVILTMLLGCKPDTPEKPENTFDISQVENILTTFKARSSDEKIEFTIVISKDDNGKLIPQVKAVLLNNGSNAILQKVYLHDDIFENKADRYLLILSSALVYKQSDYIIYNERDDLFFLEIGTETGDVIIHDSKVIVQQPDNQSDGSHMAEWSVYPQTDKTEDLFINAADSSILFNISFIVDKNETKICQVIAIVQNPSLIFDDNFTVEIKYKNTNNPTSEQLDITINNILFQGTYYSGSSEKKTIIHPANTQVQVNRISFVVDYSDGLVVANKTSTIRIKDGNITEFSREINVSTRSWFYQLAKKKRQPLQFFNF